jgi:putative membrane protein
MMWSGPYDTVSWGWFWALHFIIPILLWALIITAVVMLGRYAGFWREHSYHAVRQSGALSVLEERYARGEINRDEYLQKKQDSTG